MSACGDTGRVKGRICTTRKGDMLRTWGKLCFVGGVNFDGEGSRRLSRPNDPNIPFERPNGYNIPEVISRWIIGYYRISLRKLHMKDGDHRMKGWELQDLMESYGILIKIAMHWAAFIGIYCNYQHCITNHHNSWGFHQSTLGGLLGYIYNIPEVYIYIL